MSRARNDIICMARSSTGTNRLSCGCASENEPGRPLCRGAAQTRQVTRAGLWTAALPRAGWRLPEISSDAHGRICLRNARHPGKGKGQTGPGSSDSPQPHSEVPTKRRSRRGRLIQRSPRGRRCALREKRLSVFRWPDRHRPSLSRRMPEGAGPGGARSGIRAWIECDESQPPR